MALYAMEIAMHRGKEFWDSWKDYWLRNPVGERCAAAAAARPVSINSILGGDDDDAEAGAAAGPAGAAPAAAEANGD
jgi:hypothetical protein